EGIESLALGFPRIPPDVVIELVSAAPRLKSLDLSDTPMAAAVLEATLRRRTLRSLQARSFSDPPEEIVRLLTFAPLGLRSLTLPDLAQVDLAALHRLVRAPALREIGTLTTVGYQPLD